MKKRIAQILTVLLAACSTTPARGPQIAVTVPHGATLDVAMDSLSARGVIAHPFWFRIYARLVGLRSNLKSGTYAFHEDETWRVITEALSTGRGALVHFTTPEGLMATEVADLAQSRLGIPRDSFLLAIADPDLKSELGLPSNAPTVEGYLYPTTYLVPAKIGARDLVRAMVREFLGQWDSTWTATLDSQHLSRQAIVTVASIVEAEVRYDPDRPYVAAVYLNRLRRGMKLEADPTVIYAYGHRLKRVFEKNLLIRSPYNTYLHAGLPPGPIAQPGHASLDATIHPAEVPYLYFVAQPDGKHIFSVTYAEHLAAIQKVKRLKAAARAKRAPGHPTPAPTR
ncbi:MAG TPA: endolytic transglycosylase MltG [Gemmatimonadales bacterium]|nr:endolytic transglycosylase MltG [Gemmatimonadales bacterium]